jgi:uncharacterized protein
MVDANLTLSDIIQMTQQEGEGWAVPHARRLMELIREIGADVDYDADAVAFAAYLHDWGAFPCYAQTGVDHALRSRQVAETEILPRVDLSPSAKQNILEASELHDYRDTRPAQSAEALLLREADMLEFLGVLGITRTFSWGPKNIAIGYRRILERRAGIIRRFSLPRACQIAQIRLEHMDHCLRWLEEEIGYSIENVIAGIL